MDQRRLPYLRQNLPDHHRILDAGESLPGEQRECIGCQHRQTGREIQGFKDDMRGVVPVRRLQPGSSCASLRPRHL